MIQCPQFIYGQFGKLGYRLLKTMDLQISDESLIDLCRQGGGIKGPVHRVKLLKDEGMIAVSYIKPGHDEDRGGVWNHTILVSVEDYLKIKNPIDVFARFFLDKLDVAVNPLKLIEVEECQRKSGS